MEAIVLEVCLSKKKGTQKKPVKGALALEGKGFEGDAHAGDWHRQISLLANESAQRMRDKGANVGPGDFGENLLTEGIDLTSLPIGTRLSLGDVQLEVTQIGKKCHTRCAIYYAAGDCVMPSEGIFCRVLAGGEIKSGMQISQISNGASYTSP